MQADSVESIREYVENLATQLAGWYGKKIAWKRRISVALRVLSILLITAGGLVPLIKATWTTGPTLTTRFDLGQLGYLLIGLGGGAIAFDRFFGFSSAWIRYVTTEMAIRRALHEFRIEWARLTLAAAPVDQLLQLCKSLAMSVHGLMEQETKSWVLEFQSSLADLEKNLKTRAEEAKAPAAKAAGGAG